MTKEVDLETPCQQWTRTRPPCWWKEDEMVGNDQGLLFAVFGGGCFLSDGDRRIHKTNWK